MSSFDAAMQILLEETSIPEKWEAIGREYVARNALAEGVSIELVEKITGLDMETIKSLMPK